MVNPGITITMEWWDEDVTQISVSCSNGAFCGTALVYVSPDKLVNMSKVVDGFPKASDDLREFQLGPSDPCFAGGSVTLSFRCTDSAGHALVDLKIRADSTSSGGPGAADFSVPIEAAGIDCFVEALRLGRANFHSAYLPMRN